MRGLGGWKVPILSAAAAFAAAIIAARFVSLNVWRPVFPGLLVALSMLGAATLVRLARNSPITQPAAFDETDLNRFFDALEELNRRLYWIFIQVIIAIVLVLIAVCVAEHRGNVFGYGKLLNSTCSGLMAWVIVWLLARVISMAKGDIGFVRLQREVLENALRRQRVAAVDSAVNAPVEFRSPGGYGNSA